MTLGAETYVVTRPLTVDRSLHLRGVDRDVTSVVLFGDSAVLVLTGDIDVTLKGITFERSGPPDRDLVVARGDVRLRVSGCRIDGGLPFVVEGPAPHGHGILLVLEGGTAELLGNEIGRNAYGVGVGLASRVTLLDNTIVENAEAGVRFFGAAQGAASGNLVAMNGWGVAVVEHANVVLEGDAINGNFRGGLWFDDDASGEAIGQDIVSQPIGIVISGRAIPTVRGNYLSSAYGSGIAVQGSARPYIEGNELRGHQGFGLSFGDAAAGTVLDNVIAGNKGYGVLVSGRAAPTLTDNTLSANGLVGIFYQEEAAGVARGNVCEDEAAIETWEQSLPELVGNLCTHLDMRER